MFTHFLKNNKNNNELNFEHKVIKLKKQNYKKKLNIKKLNKYRKKHEKGNTSRDKKTRKISIIGPTHLPLAC